MEIARTELFKRVWESPLRTLAKEFDISDVGLAKACRKHGIPTPPQGHWVRVAMGRTSAPPELPTSAITMVSLDARRHRPSIPQASGSKPELAAIKVAVGSSLDELSPAAKRTFNVLSRLKPNGSGFLISGASNVFSCSISPGTLQRAIFVLDAIERALPKIDATLVQDDSGRRLLAQSGGEIIGLTLLEEYKRTELVTKHPKHSYLDQKDYQYHFLGRLKLVLDGDYQGRKIWADGVRAKLEEKLGAAVVGILDAATATADLRSRREVDKRRWEEMAKRNAEIAEERRQKNCFMELFVKEATAWRQCQTADAYLAHILKQSVDLPEPLPESSQRWIAMAEEMVRGLNPADVRVRLLQTGPDIDGWRGRFGESVVGP